MTRSVGWCLPGTTPAGQIQAGAIHLRFLDLPASCAGARNRGQTTNTYHNISPERAGLPRHPAGSWGCAERWRAGSVRRRWVACAPAPILAGCEPRPREAPRTGLWRARSPAARPVPGAIPDVPLQPTFRRSPGAGRLPDRARTRKHPARRRSGAKSSSAWRISFGSEPVRLSVFDLA
jgi:hypothetical protein